jgi:predicted house-cleaning noncanonical NTP pyrophosphatase (MazG superfamily)
MDKYSTRTKYDKLVRDLIPKVVEAKGGKAVWHVASDDADYEARLFSKLAEEVSELTNDKTPFEVADVLEVIDAICAFKKFDMAEVLTLKAKKREERGGFEGRIVLDES